ncbi:MAG: aminotransferase class V-fold PLP-dependent enzyme [Kiloniellales bacterium]|nr:aminotransferase class V-fold PLP-dependent enzyme [Kiloniellales bacterium]
MTADWSAYRKRFPALERYTYLNTAGGCAMSVDAAEAGKRYFDEMVEGGDTHWDRWIERTEVSRQRLAALLNASPQEIAFVPTASLGMNLVALMLGNPGARIIAAKKEFPSATLPWLRQGAEIDFLPLSQNGVVDLSKAKRELNPQTIAFVASHVQYHTGYRYNLGKLQSMCDSNSFHLIVDATQSVGAYPIDVKRLGIDVLLFSGYKWTTAGYGIAALYVSEDLLASVDLPVVGWRSARVPYEMVYDRLDIVHEGRALEVGHPPFPGVFALDAGVRLVQEIGVDTIAARIDDLTQSLHQGLAAAGYAIASPTDPDERSGITLARVSNAEVVAAELMRRGVFVSHVDGCIRISLHFYNDESDIDTFLRHLQDIETATSHRGT